MLLPNQGTNPYSSPAADLGSVPAPVVTFQGTLTGDDLRLTLRERPPRPGDRWRLIALTLLAALVGGRGGYEVFQGLGDPINATLMLIGGAYLSIFGWAVLIRPWFPYHRQRVQRVNNAATRQTAQSGWVDEHGVTVCSSDSVLQARWSTFAPVYLFPQHLLLPMVIDQGRRIPIPWRFFSSLQAVKEVETLLKQHVGIRRRFRARRGEMTSFACPDPPRRARPPSGHWAAGPWPEATTFSESFTIDLSQAVTPLRYAGMFLLNLLFVLLCLAPILLTVLFWALCRYQQRGSGWALLDEPLELIITAGPPLAAIVMLVAQFLTALQRARSLRREPAGLSICDRYLHLSTATYESWFRPASVRRIVQGEQAAGWVFAETLEEVKLPQACFVDAADFDRFLSALQRFVTQTPA